MKSREPSLKKKRDELTLEELQAKLDAAENRRKEYEARLKSKMQQETQKGERTRSLNSSLNGSFEKDIEEKEKQALVSFPYSLRNFLNSLRTTERRI